MGVCLASSQTPKAAGIAGVGGSGAEGSRREKERSRAAWWGGEWCGYVGSWVGSLSLLFLSFFKILVGGREAG